MQYHLWVHRYQLKCFWKSKKFYLNSPNLKRRIYSYIVVLFPAPLWPNSAVIWPSKKFSVRLLTTVFSLNFRVRFLIEIPTGKWNGSVSIFLSFAVKIKRILKFKLNFNFSVCYIWLRSWLWMTCLWDTRQQSSIYFGRRTCKKSDSRIWAQKWSTKAWEHHLC